MLGIGKSGYSLLLPSWSFSLFMPPSLQVIRLFNPSAITQHLPCCRDTPFLSPSGTITLTADQLGTAYGYYAHEGGSASNIVAAADALYKGKRLLVSGWVGGGNGVYARLPAQSMHILSPAQITGYEDPGITFRPNEKSKLVNLAEGDSITVLCRDDGMSGTRANPTGWTRLNDCLLQARVPGINKDLLSDMIKAILISDGLKLDDSANQ